MSGGAGASPWPPCRLCGASVVQDFAEVNRRRFASCEACGLIQLAAEQRLDPVRERAEYATHRNDPADPRYRAFLERLCLPLAEVLHPDAEGLDYGSGPGPTLSALLGGRGFAVRNYDPFFAPDAELLSRTWDFIACTETVEHFHEPGAEFERLHRMLRPGGWLAVMTGIFDGDRDFAGWRYAREASHVCFYRPETMAWIAGRFGYRMLVPHPNVRLFQSPETEG